MVSITSEELMAEHQMLRIDPQKYLAMINERIKSDPNDLASYFSRHQVWARLGQLDEALADLHISLKKEEKPARLFARGEIFYRLARYPDSLKDFERAEYLKPQHWGGWLPLYMAECHVRLGNGRAALLACAKIPDDYFSPGLYGVARGNKSEITADIARRASSN